MLPATLLGTALVLPGSSKVAVGPADVAAARGAILRPVAEVCAESLFEPSNAQDKAMLTATLSRDLNERFSSRNRADNALLIAEDTRVGEVVGSVGIEVSKLTRSALNEQQAKLASEDWLGESEPRPLLSNLAVCRDYRRQGIARRLCRTAEAAARSWGYTEVLLKVEKGNRKAFKLYHGLGYRVVATDTNAEKPVVSASGGLAYVKTTNIAMRKDLRRPPLDTVAAAAALLLGVVAGAPKYDAVAQYITATVAARTFEQPVQLLAELVKGCVQVLVVG